MAEAGAELHEMFTSWVHAGFSRKEALYLVGKYIEAAAIAANAPALPDGQP
jgi:hypothetical protein